MTTETEYRDWKITLPFTVPRGDTEGVMTEALFDAALELAPTEAAGIVARANADEGKVWIVLTLPNSTREFADSVAKEMRRELHEAVLSTDESCVSAA